jgi:histidine triad (HIT) family protein
MEECVFCQVIAGRLPSTQEYEDEEILAIRDIKPAAPVHLIILPKRHFEVIDQTVDPELLGRLLKTAARLAEKCGIEESYRVVINKGKWVQEIPHLHLHLMGGWQTPEEVNGG